MVAKPGQRIGLGTHGDRLVGVRVAQGDRGLAGEQLDQLEVGVAEVDLRAADARDVHAADDIALGHERDHHQRLRVVRGARDLHGPLVGEGVVGQHGFPVLDRPSHQPLAERHDVAAHLLLMPLARQHRHQHPLSLVDAVDRQVVVAHHRLQAVGNRLQHVGTVERRQQALVDLEQAALRLQLARQLGRLQLQPLVGAGIGHGLRRVAGKDRHRLQVVVAELVVPQLRQGDHAHRSALEQHRHHQHRLLDVIGALDGESARVVQRVVGEDRLAVLGHPAGEGALADVHAQGFLEVAVTQQPIGERDRLADAVLPLHRIDADVVICGQGAGLGHDRIGDGLDIGQAVQPGRQVLDGANTGRLVGHGPIQPRIADGDRRLVGEGLRQRQLVFRPFVIARVVEAQQAHGAVVDDERHQADRLDPLRGIHSLHRPHAAARVCLAHHGRSSFTNGAYADRGVGQRQAVHAGMELLAEAARGRATERMIRLVEQPQAGLLGVEQRPRPVNDVVEDRRQVQLAGQLLGHVTQGARAAHLAPGAAQDPGVQDISRDRSRHVAQEGVAPPGERTAGLVFKDQLADPLAGGAQR